ncbi:hypothetical protein ACOKM3_07160 [Streptomyces sp. BH106]|uniref:hypothetical protein n=1 Tax=Streptomyces sp. BH106 TaxID=3410409 RepID=UPI003CEDDB71
MLRSHRRNTVLAATALLGLTTMLTACQGDTGASGGSGGSGASAASDSVAKNSGSDNSEDNGSVPGRTTTGDSDSGDNAAPADSGSGDSGSAASGTGISHTYLGVVKYVAPGKFTVSSQAFNISGTTEIEGRGDICGQPEGQATKCSEAQLENAAKNETLSAVVKVVNGLAVNITDDANVGSGHTTGKVWGKLGKESRNSYYVTNSDGVRVFFGLHRLTTFVGSGLICGSANANAICTQAQFDAASRKGVEVVTDLVNGTALNIGENHN